MDKLDELLYDLSEELGETYHVDEFGGCVIEINEEIDVHLELDETERYLVLASRIIEVGPGKFRENVMRDALRSNYDINRGFGALSYHPKVNMIGLHEMMALDRLDAAKLVECLVIFSNKAFAWKLAIENGRPSPDFVHQDPTSKDIIPDKFKH